MMLPGPVQVIGRGRVGASFAARLAERGYLAGEQPPAIRLLCVPDAAIADVAGQLLPGPWIAHVSGATVLSALHPHTRRFSLHPLQTFSSDRGPEQIDGAWAAVSGETPDAMALASSLADVLGLRPFPLADDRRPVYHAGAVFASNFLVTIHRAAVRAMTLAGAPPEALLPLMRRTIDNHFDLTGPIARGDWNTVAKHLSALEAEAPDLAPLYRALAAATRPS